MVPASGTADWGLTLYVRGGPLPNDRVLDSAHGSVSFEYTDHRDHLRKTLRLSASEFIACVLWHAPPRAQHTVRRAGLYASAHCGHHQACRDQLTDTPMPAPDQPIACHQLSAAAPARCPVCNAALVYTASLLPMHRFSEFSIAAAVPRAGCAGPTGGSNGQPTAPHDCTLRRRFSRRRFPFN